MAIYHLSAKIISRSSGRSATGAAAYRAGQQITDERTGLVHDYTRKGGVDHTEILTPANAPEWAHDRAKLWNGVEAAEKRKDAQLCREVEVAIPCELTPEQMRDLVREFVRAEFVNRGMVADVALHHVKSENPHAHILLTTRDIGPDGFGQKNRDWNRKELLEEWRESWERHANLALERAGHDARIDHRTLEAQGIDRVPQIHIGPRVVEMEARGVQTERGGRALAIEATNDRITELQTYRESIEHERDHEIAAGPQRRAVGERDRAAGPELGGPGRRDAANLEQPGTGQPGAGHGVEPAAATGRRGAEVGGIEHRRGRAAAQETGRGRDGSQPGPDMAALPSGNSDRGLYGGARERILALAETARGAEHAGRASAGRIPETGHRRSGEAREGAEMSQPDRTYLAARRQLEAMGCESFEVGIRDQEGRMLTRTWSKAEVLKSVPWLKRENAKGADIYVRPAGEENQGLVLVDDLTKGQLDRMKSEGYAPAVVIETSPLNHQAWVRLSDRPLSPEVATTASKALAKHFEADPNSADWRHFGRLAGFTNRKPSHTTETGRNPWVLCHEAPGKVAENGPELAQKAQQRVFEREARVERQTRLEAARNASERVYGRDAVKEYQRQLKRLEARYGADMDVSKADFMICKDMAKQGYSADQLERALHTASPELPTRKAGHEADYCERTVRAAFADPEVRQELQRQNTIGKGYEGPSNSL